MEPIVQFTSGTPFGDIALLKSKGRAGTVLSQTGCFFAVIGGDSYEKLLRKEMLQEQSNSIVFLRQIPYMNNWSNKDVIKIWNYRDEKIVENRGQVIAREGDLCQKVIIILEGEVEVVKTDLSKLLFNADQGVVAIAECNKKAQLVRSKSVRLKEEGGLQNMAISGMSHLVKYIGSEFYEDV